MSEKRIQQVLEIERHAQEIHDGALRDAQQLPILAEQDAQAMMEKSLAEVREEARKLVSKAQAEEEVARILAQVEDKNRQDEALAMSNFDRAVAYILERITGKV